MSVSKVKVLHLGLCPNRGGIESIVYSWWKHIEQESIHFDFINVYHEKIAFENEFRESGSQVFYIPARKENPKKHREELKRIIIEGKYDFVHCHVMSLSEPEPVEICSELSHTKVIIHSHTVAKLGNMGLKRKVLHTYGSIRLKGYDYLKIACGYEAGKEMFRSDDFTVVENGIDIDRYKYTVEKRNRFREKYGIPEDAIVIGHVGRPDKAKNYPFLIETYALLKKKVSDAILLLIGDVNNDKEIKSLLEKYKVVSSTVLTGKISSTEDCYSAMDVFFLPSNYEGISVSMIEAQASGVQCVVSENIAHESAVSDHVSFMPIDNAESMVKEIMEYLKPYNDLRGSRIIKPNYDIRVSASKLAQYYYEHKCEER